MLRALVLSGLLAAAPVAVLSFIAPPAPKIRRSNAPTPPRRRPKGRCSAAMLNSLGGSLLGRAGVAGNVVSLALPVGSYLTDELLKKLDCKEQVQAAKATDQAVRGGVGTEVAWKSDSRANVTGKSTVTGEEKLADGGQCLTVTDVVIVDGEETTVPKRMCKAKGASGYARV